MSSYNQIDQMAIKQERGMRRSTAVLISTISVFAVLTAIGVGMIAGARGAADAFEQSALMHVGSALFGGGLAFFLVQVFWWAREWGQFSDDHGGAIAR